MASSKHSSSKLSGALKNDEQEDEDEMARSKSTTTVITSKDQIDMEHQVGSNKIERVENNFNDYNVNEDDDTDDDVDEDENENEELDAFRSQEHRRRRMTNSSILSSSSAGSSRLSQQYLIHNSVLNSSISPSNITPAVAATTTKTRPTIQNQEPVNQYSNSNKYKMRQSINKDDYLYSYSTEINKKKLKQIIQSKPLAVACIIIVFILFLTLSESKTLQVAQGAVQSLVMEPPPVIESGAKLVREGDDLQQQEKQQQQQHQSQQQLRRRQLQLSNESSNQVEQPDARLINQQLAFKREFINNLIQRHQTQFQPRQQRKQVLSETEQQAAIPTGQQAGVSSKHDFASTGSGAVSGTGTETFKSLSAMLFGGNSASGQAPRDTPTQIDEGSEQEAPTDSYIDGEPSALRSHEVADLRPASLRSSAIELDLNGDQLQQQQQQQQQYHTQPLFHQNQNQNHQHQRHQNHIHRQQSNRYHQQQQAHKMNEEQQTKQQQQLLLQQQNLDNNHERAFDVVQVRKYSYLFLLLFFLPLLLKCLISNTSEAIDHAS